MARRARGGGRGCRCYLLVVVPLAVWTIILLVYHASSSRDRYSIDDSVLARSLRGFHLGGPSPRKQLKVWVYPNANLDAAIDRIAAQHGVACGGYYSGVHKHTGDIQRGHLAYGAREFLSWRRIGEPCANNGKAS